MQRIVHISDLHFGDENKLLINKLLEIINALKPILIVISGDFTQRATTLQFLAAQDFLNSLSSSTLCVPGNHDIPLYHVWNRIFHPFKRYQQYINKELEPIFINEQLKILGVNSATPFRVKNGMINKQSFDKMKNLFNVDDTRIKILVMHHNLAHIKKYHHPIVNEAEIQQALASLKIDIVLSGHLHFPYIVEKKNLYNSISHKTFLVTAGTALSYRLRKSENSFNCIILNEKFFEIEIYHFIQNNFTIIKKDKFFF